MTFLQIFAALLAVLGIVGSIVPGLPGPPVSWAGVLCAYFCSASGSDPLPLAVLLAFLAVTVVVTVADYLVPSWMTRSAGGHKAASAGAVIGLLLGMFFTPVGMIGGSLLGAFAGELLVTGSGFLSSVKASLGAFAGFLCGTLMKLICSAAMAWCIFTHLS